MRGEGNHKIPASFAPENMEKTGAERVKYSLACQHEDAIPIKFVPYAQKCPTVLCTFAVALRKESVDRNTNFCPASLFGLPVALRKESVDRNILSTILLIMLMMVALRKESVDRNFPPVKKNRPPVGVALRKESVDRNTTALAVLLMYSVALRKESVDRNKRDQLQSGRNGRRSPQGERG